VQQDAIAGLIVPGTGPTRPGQCGAGDAVLIDQVGPDAIGEGFAVGVADSHGRHPIGAMRVQVGQHGGGHGGQGLVPVDVVMFPAGVVAHVLALGDVAVAEVGQSLAFDRVDLAAVHRQLRHRQLPVAGLVGDPVGQPAGSNRLGLEGVAYQPHHCLGTGGGRRQDGIGLPGGQLRKFVHDHDRSGRRVAAILGEAGHRHGRDADLAQLIHRLVGGRHRQHRPSGPTGRLHGGGQRGGLAVAGRRDQRPQRRPGGAERVDGGGLVVAQPDWAGHGGANHDWVDGNHVALLHDPDGGGPDPRCGGASPWTTGQAPGHCCPDCEDEPPDRNARTGW
jgi:hypothetical protein